MQVAHVASRLRPCYKPCDECIGAHPYIKTHRIPFQQFLVLSDKPSGKKVGVHLL